VKQKRYLKDYTPWKKEYYKADVYWPVDFLAKDFPDARILVYGYDSKVSKFFKGPADKSSFMGHAKELLQGLVDIRSEAVGQSLSDMDTLFTLYYYAGSKAFAFHLP
jgi:hypothetical protein